jgi:hypothetical protein
MPANSGVAPLVPPVGNHCPGGPENDSKARTAPLNEPLIATSPTPRRFPVTPRTGSW